MLRPLQAQATLHSVWFAPGPEFLKQNFSEINNGKEYDNYRCLYDYIKNVDNNILFLYFVFDYRHTATRFIKGLGLGALVS